MKCECGGKLSVCDSREFKAGFTRRRRECKSCKTRTTTLEVTIPNGVVIADEDVAKMLSDFFVAIGATRQTNVGCAKRLKHAEGLK